MGTRRKDLGESFLEWLLKLLSESEEIEFEDFNLEASEFQLDVTGVASIVKPMLEAAKSMEARAIELIEELPKPEAMFTNRIAEVRIGATRSEGGSRGRVIVIGGEVTMPFYSFSALNPNPPVVSGDVFDWKLPLPKPLRDSFGDAMDDPAEWAKLYIDKFDADMVTVELTSTDPSIRDTPVREAVKVVENVLQAVDSPVMVGGSGDPVKDVELLTEVAAIFEGERLLLSSIPSPEDRFKPIAEAAKRYGHNVVAWASLDINLQRDLDRAILNVLPPERIVIDPTSAPLGYGIEYAFSVMERIRIAGLMGDRELALPMLSGTSNAWGAREAWLKTPELGPREVRGPLWEAITALTFLLAGCDLFIMMHPLAIKTVKQTISWLYGRWDTPAKAIPNWLEEM
ncbi:MAG: CO dehydrogenase/acetyl-CoA synthase subunit delta [Candidatus Bathyarchaeota archaeon]|nr:CO dehydrogenase/acetyl-CoA synthase subunit delta [Candidatus Bathyarchaeota archaeon]